MASYGYTFSAGDTVTPTKLNNARTVSDIVNADIDASAAIALSKLATGALPSAITVASANLVDGTIAVADLAAAVANALVPAGAIQPFARNTAPAGWLAANGNTIGSASSNATHASADYEALFTVLWGNGWTDATLPMLTSAGASVNRGASAAADWAANRRITLPDLQGIFVRGSGSQTISGTTYSGTFAAKQQDEFKAHTHVQNYSNVGSGGSGVGVGGVAGYAGQVASNLITGSSGGTETRPANIALLYCIKF